MIKRQAETNRQRKAVYKTRNSLGFTMAELLIVVAIIGVLSAVSFVAVQTHQKNLSQAELDAIAKQIYVAAQNHLIMAENENYLGSTDFGTPLDTDHGGTDQDAKNGIYYFTSDQFSSDNNLLDQMLPFGALDETVRAGGNYIIFYQPESATVLDVFYAKDACTFNGATRAGFGGTDKKNTRRDNNPMMGWYGGYDNSDANAANGVADLRQGSWLENPTIVVENAEKLKVFVNDPNWKVDNEQGFMFQLIISGLNPDGTETGAKAAITLRSISASLTSERVTRTPEGSYEVVLDDVTYDAMDEGIAKHLHFAGIEKGNTTGANFVPGQNISIQAIAYNTELRSNIASSNVEITNSLFERISEDGSIAYINNIRHLENLEEDISGLNKDVYKPVKAVQTSDMSWTNFTKGINPDTPSNVCVCTSGSYVEHTNDGCYMPVSPSYALSYDGQNYNVYDLKVSYNRASGMFGSLTGGTDVEVKNLELIDFAITSTSGNAGALAGTMNNMTVTNVVAYNTNTENTETIIGTGSVGGLIGETTGCTVSKSAAALVVKSSGGDAGGLIGTSSDGTVTASYSGGHTRDAEYSTEKYNVTSEASDKNAGGLIGKTENTTITYCYSTCSAAGAIAGGLVGDATGNISNSYATGLVRSTATTPVEGAFAGKHKSGTLSGNHYFEIINEREETDSGFTYLTALGQGQSNSGITAIDETAATYNAFCWPAEEATWTGDKWAGAMVYDKKLIEYYGVAGDNGRNARYRLKTVAQLGANLKTSAEDTTEYFVTTHYGDWPAPEIFVFNTKASGS